MNQNRWTCLILAGAMGVAMSLAGCAKDSACASKQPSPLHASARDKQPPKDVAEWMGATERVNPAYSSQNRGN